MYRFGAAVGRWDELAGRERPASAGHFSGQFHCNALHAPWWREREKSGGQIVEQLIHIVDLARHALGMPDTVYARAANLFHRDVPGYDSEDVSAIILGYDDGRIGVLHASNAAVPGRWAKGWQIVARDMTGIFADWNRAELVRTARRARDEPPIAGDTRRLRRAARATSPRAIRERRPPRVPLDGRAPHRCGSRSPRGARPTRGGRSRCDRGPRFDPDRLAFEAGGVRSPASRRWSTAGRAGARRRRRSRAERRGAGASPGSLVDVPGERFELRGRRRATAAIELRLPLAGFAGEKRLRFARPALRPASATSRATCATAT